MVKNIPRMLNSTFDPVFTKLMKDMFPNITRVHIIDAMPSFESEVQSYLMYRELYKNYKENGKGNAIKVGVLCCKKEKQVDAYCKEMMDSLDITSRKKMITFINEVAPTDVKNITYKHIRSTSYAILFFKHAYDSEEFLAGKSDKAASEIISMDNIDANMGLIQDQDTANYLIGLYKDRKCNMSKLKIIKCYNPYDIIWDNLGSLTGPCKAIILDVLLFFLCILIIPAIAGGSIINSLLNTIAKDFNIGIVTYFIENYCASLIMTLVNSVLIPFLVNLISQYEGIETREKLETKIMMKNTFFQIMCCVILPLLSLTTIMALINQIINSQQFLNVLYNIAQSLVTQSLYFLNYSIQTVFFSNLLSFMTLYYLLPDFFKLIMEKAFSKIYSSHDDNDFKVGYNSALIITNFTYCLFFSLASPLINIFAFMIFYTKYYIDLYNLTHNYAFRTKSPLQYGDSLILSIFSASILYILGMSCFFYININLAAGLCFFAFGVFYYVSSYVTLLCGKWKYFQVKFGLSVMQTKNDDESPVRISIIQMDEDYQKRLYYLYQNTYYKLKDAQSIENTVQQLSI